MAIEFPKLPFEFDSLEPAISRKTLEFHYGKHHKGYVDKLNKLIKDTPFDNHSLEEIMQASYNNKTKIYNNAAQAWNHDFMWKCLAKKGTAPSANLEKIIAKKFGSVDEFKYEFVAASKDLFGSGWTWLVKNNIGDVQIRALSNAENPMQLGEIPLLTCDIWEHAYYLDYQNERPKYLESYWSIINWEFVEQNLAAGRVAVTPRISSSVAHPG